MGPGLILVYRKKETILICNKTLLHNKINSPSGKKLDFIIKCLSKFGVDFNVIKNSHLEVRFTSTISFEDFNNLCCVTHSVMSNSLQPHGLQPVRLLCPWNSPSKNTGVGCHFLFQEIFLTQGSNLGLLHCRQILYCLSYQGSPINNL